MSELEVSGFQAIEHQLRHLPARALRVLYYFCKVYVPGAEIPVTWNEYSPHSNYDRYDRGRLRQLAEDVGLIEYRHGHPRVTPAGGLWARERGNGERA